MIQPAPVSDLPVTLHLPQLSAARPRTGMRSLGELVECLVKYYEARSRVEDRTGNRTANTPALSTACRNMPGATNQGANAPGPPDECESQAVFGWYDSASGSVPAGSH
jgi:hypothetical protein